MVSVYNGRPDTTGWCATNVLSAWLRRDICERILSPSIHAWIAEEKKVRQLVFSTRPWSRGYSTADRWRGIRSSIQKYS